MKLCKDCASSFMDAGSSVVEYAKCLKKQWPAEVSPVTGEITEPATHAYCKTARGSESLCGEEGKWWTPRDPGQKVLISRWPWS